jgi:hypothetical protein
VIEGGIVADLSKREQEQLADLLRVVIASTLSIGQVDASLPEEEVRDDAGDDGRRCAAAHAP